MKNFDRGGKKFGGKDFGNRGGDRRFGDKKLEMFHAVCSNCGKDCEVPFKPTGDKPVFCRDCFKNQAGGQRNADRGDSRGGFKKPMYIATCDNCGKRCEVPFRPTGDKPVYCSDCFGKRSSTEGGKSSSSASGQMEKQLAAIGSKLDSILNLLAPHVAKSDTAAGKPAKKAVVAKKASAAKKKPAAKKKK